MIRPFDTLFLHHDVFKLGVNLELINPLRHPVYFARQVATMKESDVLFLHFCIQYSSITILYFDYLLTFTAEVQYIWNRRLSISTALYIGCRYGLAANAIYPFILTNKLPSPDRWKTLCGALGVIGRACILTVWSLRTWAVWNKNNFIALLLGPWILVCVILDTIESTSLDTDKIDDVLAILVVAFEWTSTALTMFKCLRIMMKDPYLMPKQSLFREVIAQGLFYICAVSCFTLSTVILRYKAPPGSFYQNMLVAYTLPISGLFTARFILHMRSFDSRGMDTPDPILSTARHMSFANGNRDEESYELDE